MRFNRLTINYFKTFCASFRIITFEGNARKYFLKLKASFGVGFWQMLLFIIIFLAMTITVGLSAVVGFSFLHKRRAKSLQTNKQNLIEPPSYHSLFVPNEAEIRAFERADKLQAEAEKTESANNLLRSKAEQLSEFNKVWTENPNKKNTIELLFLATQTESAKTFSETVKSVIQVWQTGKLKSLTAADLAQLAESHLWLLPPQERTSGAVFWLKQEIADLRRKSEGNSI